MKSTTHAGTPAVLPLMRPLSDLMESPLNPRKHFDPAFIEGMAVSMRSFGVIEPLVIRTAKPKAKAPWEIIAGAQRIRAARKAGLTEVPVSYKELTDGEVLEVMVIENDQRDGLHFLEQSEAYARIMKEQGYSVDLLAEKLGREAGYVYRRVQLAELIGDIKKECATGSIPFTHALALARLQPPDQARAFKDALFQLDQYAEKKTVVTMAQLNNWIRTNIYLELKSAPFSRESADLVPAAGACMTCTKRTGANYELFDDVKKGDDRCLDARCYKGKREAFIQLTITKAKEKGDELVPIALGYWPDQDAKKNLPKGTLVVPYDRNVEKGSCPHVKHALIINGGMHGQNANQVGQRIYICGNSKCKVHNLSYHYQAPKPTASQVWQQKERELKLKIDRAARALIRDAVLAKVKAVDGAHMKAIAAALVDRVSDVPDILERLGLSEPNPKAGVMETAIWDLHDADVPMLALRIALEDDVQTGRAFGLKVTSLERLAARHKVDVKKLTANVTREMMKEFKVAKAADQAARRRAANKPKKAWRPAAKKRGAK